MRAPQPPNRTLTTSQTIALEFLKDTINDTRDRFHNLIIQNQCLGGDALGYTFQGHRQTRQITDEYLSEIHPSLEPKAEALFLRQQNQNAMITKLQQAMGAVFQRCKEDLQILRDALPDKFVEHTQLSVYSRQRPQAYYLKVHPMLAAPYRVIDEAILFRDRYRLLD